MPDLNNENQNLWDRYTEAFNRRVSSDNTVRSRRAEPVEAVAPPINLERAFSSWYNDSDDEVNEDFEPEYIREYNYIPKAFNFNKVKSSEEDLFFGAEIEVDCGGKNDDVAKEIIDILGDQNVYCKHDGSLTAGFEIVTHPATLYYHQSMEYKKAFDYLVKHGYRAHDTDTCGLHIHFNKNFFGKDKFHQDMNISKLLYIFEKFYQQIELIARRKHNDYARRYYMEENETVFDMYSKAKSANKYGAINLKHNDTVEIRIFKGTLNYETFMITLQFVRNIVKTIKRISIYEIQFCTWDSIFNKFSPELKQYYCERAEQEKQEELKKEEKRKKREEERQRDMASMMRSSRDRVDTIDYGRSRTYSPSFSFDWSAYITPLGPLRIRSTEEVEIERIENEIVETRRRIRDTRNQMERLTLERHLDELDTELREVRSRTA